jgi:hypothetical protein
VDRRPRDARSPPGPSTPADGGLSRVEKTRDCWATGRRPAPAYAQHFSRARRDRRRTLLLRRVPARPVGRAGSPRSPALLPARASPYSVSLSRHGRKALGHERFRRPAATTRAIKLATTDMRRDVGLIERDSSPCGTSRAAVIRDQMSTELTTLDTLIDAARAVLAATPSIAIHTPVPWSPTP